MLLVKLAGAQTMVVLDDHDNEVLHEKGMLLVGNELVIAYTPDLKALSEQMQSVNTKQEMSDCIGELLKAPPKKMTYAAGIDIIQLTNGPKLRIGDRIRCMTPLGECFTTVVNIDRDADGGAYTLAVPAGVEARMRLSFDISDDKQIGLKIGFGNRYVQIYTYKLAGETQYGHVTLSDIPLLYEVVTR